MLVQQSTEQDFDLYYGDATAVSEQGYIPYGWQFKNETISIPCRRGRRVNIFGIYSRDNRFLYWIDSQSINAAKMVAILDEISWSIRRPTMLVLDNASVHRAQCIRELIPYWQQRGLYLFFLPPYSPQLNIIERLWKEIKARYLKVEDYQTTDQLFYAVNRICANIGTALILNFK